MTSYVHELDDKFRQQSNRTYRRILAALPLQVASRYGYAPGAQETWEEKLREAVAEKN